VKKLLKTNEKKLEKVVNELLKKESLTADEIKNIL
jgi:ATP-dependent Zn protease